MCGKFSSTETQITFNSSSFLQLRLRQVSIHSCFCARNLMPVLRRRSRVLRTLDSLNIFHISRKLHQVFSLKSYTSFQNYKSKFQIDYFDKSSKNLLSNLPPKNRLVCQSPSHLLCAFLLFKSSSSLLSSGCICAAVSSCNVIL